MRVGVIWVCVGCMVWVLENWMFVVQVVMIGVVDWSLVLDMNIGEVMIYVFMDCGFFEDGIFVIICGMQIWVIGDFDVEVFE